MSAGSSVMGSFIINNDKNVGGFPDIEAEPKPRLVVRVSQNRTERNLPDNKSSHRIY